MSVSCLSLLYVANIQNLVLCVFEYMYIIICSHQGVQQHPGASSSYMTITWYILPGLSSPPLPVPSPPLAITTELLSPVTLFLAECGIGLSLDYFFCA